MSENPPADDFGFRTRALLVKRGETAVCLDPRNIVIAIGVRPQQLACSAMPGSIDRILLGKERQHHLVPTTFRHKEAGEIVVVQPMRDDHDRVSARAIQARHKRRIKHIVDALELRFIIRVDDIEGIIEYQQISTKAGDRAADGNRVQLAALACRKVHHARVISSDPRRKEFLVPGQPNDALNPAGEIAGQRFAVSHQQNVRGGPLRQPPGRQTDGAHEAFKVPRRQINNETRRLAAIQGRDLGTQMRHVRLRPQQLAMGAAEALLREGLEVAPDKSVRVAKPC